MKLKQITLAQARDILRAIGSQDMQFDVKFQHVAPAHRKDWFRVDIFEVVGEFGEDKVAQKVKARYTTQLNTGDKSETYTSVTGTVATLVEYKLSR